MRRFLRGISLGTTIIIIGLLLTVGMAMAGASITHLNLMTRATHQDEALSLARSTASLAIERLIAAPTRGQSRDAADAISLQLQSEDPNANGQVSFEKTNSLNIPYSTNNLASSVSAQGALNHVVPANSVHVVAVGRSGGVTQQVEVVVTVPPFPYGIASDGNIDASGGLQIAGIRTVPTGPVSTTDLLPADLLSNANILLGPGCLIKGDLQAGGQLQYVNGASNLVSGTVRAGAAPRQIPTLNLSTYDPQANNYAFTTLPSTSSGTTPVQGMARREGNFSVSGDLKLDGGLVYVNGDLTVTGGIQGKGLVVATGKVNVANCSNLAGGSNMALLAGDDVNLAGSDSQGSYLQGLVYSQGNFSANKVTVVGTMVTKGSGTFRDARLLTPTGSGVTTVPTQAPGVTSSSSNAISLYLGYTPPSGQIGNDSLPLPGLAAGGGLGAWTTVAHPTTSAWTASFVVQKVQTSSGYSWQLNAYRGTQSGGATVAGAPTVTQLTYDPSSPNTPGLAELTLAMGNALRTLPQPPTTAELNSFASTWLSTSGGVQGSNSAPITPVVPTDPTPSYVPAPASITIDPSSVLSLSERMRVTVWKEN